MSRSKTTRRRRRRSSDAPMPMGGAGLIRFFQDESTGIKVGPIVTVILSVVLILVVIMAHNGWFSWIF